MSRMALCIDNGPMEGVLGHSKTETHYVRHFASNQELAQMINHYIRYYNTKWVQRNLSVYTPLGKHQ